MSHVLVSFYTISNLAHCYHVPFAGVEGHVYQRETEEKNAAAAKEDVQGRCNPVDPDFDYFPELLILDSSSRTPQLELFLRKSEHRNQNTHPKVMVISTTFSRRIRRMRRIV